ncbi:hypothetical protein [Clostridium isatidis]|uniref:hypothetical protein n=1 Tax=Clostridium isatidis TaxID=182773 RepID=UPI003AAD569E
MGEIIIKGVGKKIIVDNEKILVNKKIGKNIEIPISNIKTITYDEGTMQRNGIIHIQYNENKKEGVFFYYSYNDIVKEFVNSVVKKINNPEEELIIEEKEKIGIFQQLNKESKEQVAVQLEEKQKEKEKLAKYDKEGIPYCPKCHSTSVQYIERGKKLSVGRAIVGGTLFGQTGAVLGGLTSKKVKGKLKCLKCGHEWKI